MTDSEIIQGLIDRDNRITHLFFFDRCRPLLSSIMRNVFCYPVDYREMVSLLYDYLVADDCAKLRQFQFRSSLYQWLKALHHVGRLLEMKGLHVERRYDAKADDIQKALRENKHVIAIIDKNELSSIPTSNANPAYHAIYVDAIDASPENGKVFCIKPFDGDLYSIDSDVFQRAWRKSGCYMVAVSDSSGVYNPQPIYVEDIVLEADLEDLTEAIAENAHDIQAHARMDEGWTYGPVRDDVRKLHPDLIPYSRLPESEKEYDRIMAMNTLRLVRRLGYDIINRNNF